MDDPVTFHQTASHTASTSSAKRRFTQRDSVELGSTHYNCPSLETRHEDENDYDYPDPNRENDETDCLPRFECGTSNDPPNGSKRARHHRSFASFAKKVSHGYLGAEYHRAVGKKSGIQKTSRKALAERHDVPNATSNARVADSTVPSDNDAARDLAAGQQMRRSRFIEHSIGPGRPSPIRPPPADFTGDRMVLDDDEAIRLQFEEEMSAHATVVAEPGSRPLSSRRILRAVRSRHATELVRERPVHRTSKGSTIADGTTVLYSMRENNRSSIYNFGKRITSSIARIWTRPGEPDVKTPREKANGEVRIWHGETWEESAETPQQAVLRRRKENAEALYQQLKVNGRFNAENVRAYMNGTLQLETPGVDRQDELQDRPADDTVSVTSTVIDEDAAGVADMEEVGLALTTEVIKSRSTSLLVDLDEEPELREPVDAPQRKRWGRIFLLPSSSDDAHAEQNTISRLPQSGEKIWYHDCGLEKTAVQAAFHNDSRAQLEDNGIATNLMVATSVNNTMLASQQASAPQPAPILDASLPSQQHPYPVYRVQSLHPTVHSTPNINNPFMTATLIRKSSARKAALIDNLSETKTLRMSMDGTSNRIPSLTVLASASLSELPVEVVSISAEPIHVGIREEQNECNAASRKVSMESPPAAGLHNHGPPAGPPRSKRLPSFEWPEDVF